MKECKDCKSIKPLTEFGTRKNGRYTRTTCKLCYNNHLRDWRNSQTFSIDGIKRSGVNLRKKYGITLDQYADMYESQSGACYVCGGSEYGKLLVVDHNHNTGEIRALLCSPCNKALGFVRENTTILNSLINYVEEFNV